VADAKIGQQTELEAGPSNNSVDRATWLLHGAHRSKKPVEIVDPGVRTRFVVHVDRRVSPSPGPTQNASAAR